MKLKTTSSILTIIILIMLSQDSESVINKCCGPGESIIRDARRNLVCNATSTDFIFPKHLLIPRLNISDEDLQRQEIVVGMPNCSKLSMDILYHSIENINITDFLFHLDGDEMTLKVVKQDSLHDLNVEHAERFPRGTYCLDRLYPRHYIVLVCPCQVIQCVRKCCTNSRRFNSTSQLCDAVSKDAPDWFPRIRQGQEKNVSYYRLVGKKPDCGNAEGVHRLLYIPEEIKSIASNSNKLYLLQNGSLQTEDKKRTFPVDDYCTEYSPSSKEEIVIYCSPDDKKAAILSLLTGIMFIIGAVALLITVTLTIVFPQMRKNLYNKMALAHNTMLLIGYTTTGVAHLSRGELDSRICQITGFIIQFSMLASFFWLNAMCIDISWVFSGFQQVQGQEKKHTRKKLIYFSLYAWGATSLFTIGMAVAEFTSLMPSLAPDMGKAQCFFNNDDAQWVFMYGPMAVLLSLNISLFLYTVFRIARVKRQTAILSQDKHNSSTAHKANKQTLIVFLKLFCLMGVTWIGEVISWAVGGDGLYWAPLDMLNLARAIFVFAIFCCTTTVYHLLRDGFVRIANRMGASFKASNDVTSSTGTVSSRLEMEVVQKTG